MFLQIFSAAPFPRLRVPLPMVSSEVCAGFPSPADDHLEDVFDLNELLVRNPPATFMVRVAGESMREAHICHGDILIVDRAETACHGDVVAAQLDGEFNVKRLRVEGRRIFLDPANGDFAPVEIGSERDFTVWGVVTGKVTQFRRASHRKTD